MAGGRSWMIIEDPSNPNCFMTVMNQSRRGAMIFVTLLQHKYVPFGTYFSVYFHTLISLIHFALAYQNTALFPGYYSNRIFLSLVATHSRHQKKKSAISSRNMKLQVSSPCREILL